MCGEFREHFVHMQHFAMSLRKRAQELGLAHAEVARRAGLSERRFGNYVTGRREPDLATLVKIAEVLGTNPTELLMGQGAGAKASAADLARQRIEAAVGTLGKEDLDRVAVMIEALAAERATK